MSLEADIQDIQTGLKAGRYANEAAVSQGIILRLLSRLGWQIFDASQVWPEYALGSGRVDYALCCQPSRPSILIESKNVGLALGAERQLFEYAFHQGIPMAVLTDGQEWSFFLPGEQGAYHERCVYKLDLVARPVEESARVFGRYLTFSGVASGKALDAAKTDYRTVSRTREIKDALPVAWRQILKDQDELLVDLIAERVATICGFKPEPETVADFIEKLAADPRPTVQSSPSVVAPARPLGTPLTDRTDATDAPFSGFVLNGQRYNEGNAIGTLMRVLEVLAARDQQFLERYAALPKHGRKRRYLSRDKTLLYPGRPDLCEEYSVSKFGGWWVGTNFSRSTIRHAVELACQVSSLRYGGDLKLV